MSAITRPDGVYAGFTGSGFHGNPFSHVFLAIVHDGKATIIEYGNDPSGKLSRQLYGDELDKADFGIESIKPPPGVTEHDFEQRIYDAAKRYDALPASQRLTYDAVFGANCENMASGLLKAAGVLQADIERIPWAHTARSFDPHFSKPLDLESYFKSIDRSATHADTGIPPPVNPPNHITPARAHAGASSVNPDVSSLNVVRNGHTSTMSAGYTQQGRILSTDGDRIVQDVGRGTAVYSRKELEAHFGDTKGFDAMIQPGNYVRFGVGHDGVVDVQKQVAGHGWESTRHQPSSSGQCFGR